MKISSLTIFVILLGILLLFYVLNVAVFMSPQQQQLGGGCKGGCGGCGGCGGGGCRGCKCGGGCGCGNTNTVISRGDTEGFISYNSNLISGQNTTVVIPNYLTSNYKVYYLYDNFYFDLNNGNLIEIDGKAKIEDSSVISGNVVIDGNVVIGGNTNVLPPSQPNTGDADNITDIYLCTRRMNVVVSSMDKDNFKASASIPAPVISNINNGFLYNSRCANTNQYRVSYVPYHNKTFISMFDMTNDHFISFYCDPNPTLYAGAEGKVFSNSTTLTAPINQANYNKTTTPTTATTPIHPNNMKAIIDVFYSPNTYIYQLSKFVWLDYANGNLLIQYSGTSNTGAGRSVRIYDRTGAIPTTSTYGGATPNADVMPNSNANTFISWCVYDLLCNQLIHYMGIGAQTTVIVYSLDTHGHISSIYNNTNYSFTQSGIDLGVDTPLSNIDITNNLDMDFITNNNNNIDVSMNGGGGMDSYYSNYFKWKFFWDRQEKRDAQYLLSDDYVKKTQILPPDGQLCSGCGGAGGVCANCGGFGGNGMVGGGGTGGGYGTDAYGRTLSAIGNAGGAIGSGLERTGMGLRNAVGDAGTSAWGGAREMGSETREMAGEAGKSAWGGAREIGSETREIVGDVGTSAWGGAREIGSEAREIVGETSSAIGSGLERTGTGIVNTVGGAGKSVWGGAEQIAGGTLNTLGRIGSSISNIGENGVRVGGGGGSNYESGEFIRGGDGRIPTASSSYMGTRGGNDDINKFQLDPYSYGGQPPNTQSSSFIPVVSDFSAFRK